MNYSLWTKKGWYYCRANGKQYALKTQDREEAESQALKLSTPQVTLTKLLEHYLEEKPHLSERTTILARDYINELISYHGEDVSALTKATMLEYKAFLQAKNKYNTVKIKLGAIRTVFNLAFEDGLIQHQPFKGVVVGRSQSKMVYLTKPEIKRLMDKCDNQLHQGYILFLLYSGCRLGELGNLRWDDIKGNHIELNGKTGHRLFPLNPELKQTLGLIKSLVKIEGHNYVLVDRYGRWMGRYSQLGKIVKKYIRKAGLNEAYTAHTLRHTYCSHLVMSGIPIYTVAKLAGHASVKTTELYAHLRPELLEVRVDYGI